MAIYKVIKKNENIILMFITERWFIRIKDLDHFMITNLLEYKMKIKVFIIKKIVFH